MIEEYLLGGMEIKLGNFTINLDNLQSGSRVDDNELLKKYDKDGNSIFSYGELYELKKDLENAAGNDKNLSEAEALALLARKFNITVQEAAQRFKNAREIINKEMENLASQKDAKEITNSLHKLIEDNWSFGSVNKPEFAENFNKINEKNIIYVLENYKKLSNGESLSTAIFKERTSYFGEKDMRSEYVQKLYEMLYKMIDKTKYDTSEIERVFNEAIKDGTTSENQKKLDLVFDTMVGMIKGTVTDTSATTEQAVNSGKQRNADAKSTVDNKSGSQGKVSEFLDYLAGKFNGLTEEEVNQIIKEHEHELAELEKLKDKPDAFAAKFKEIFGVNYNPKLVANYDKINATYEDAKGSYFVELQIKARFDEIFKLDYNSYCDVMRRYPNQGKLIENTIYTSMCNLLGKELVDTYLKENRFIDKYSALKQLADDMTAKLHSNTVAKCNGQTFEELSQQRENAYHAAYGFSNDTYLKAQDWVSAQNQRLGNTQLGVTAVAIAGSLFTGGGSLALLSGAALLTNPVDFVERATDPDGMTKEDWKNFYDNTAETLGWMALGLGASKVGALAANAAKSVKLKGLSQLMKKGGKSLDDLLKNSQNLDPAIVSQIKQAQKLGQAIGITTEAAVDITTTAMLQKEGATSGDWIMSIAGAILGSSKIQASLKSAGSNAVSKVKELFPSLNISDTDAMKILKQAGIEIRNINTRLNNWSKTETKRYGLAYSSIIPISPEMLEKTAKLVTRIVTNGVEKLFSAVDSHKMLGKYKAQSPKMYDAISEAMTDITTKICAGDIPSKSMLSDEALTPIAEKFGVDVDDLRDNIKDLMNDDPNWEIISGYFEMSPSQAKSLKDDAIAEIDTLKKNLGLEEKPVTQGSNIVNNKTQNGVEGLFTSENAINRLNTLKKHPKLYSAVEEALIEITSKICDGEIPCKEMFSPEGLSSIAAKHGVDKTQLSTQVLEIMQKDKDWNVTISGLATKPKRTIVRDTSEANSLVAKFRNKLGLYSKEHENAIEKLYTILKNEIAKGETPSEELLQSAANSIAKEFNVSSDELVSSIKQRMVEKDSSWRDIAPYFNKPKDKINQGSILDDNLNKFKEKNGIEVAAKVEETPTQSNIESKADTQNTTTVKKEEKFIVTDELYAKYEKDVYETRFFNSDSRAKAVEIMEAYEKHIARENINYHNFDSTEIYKFINKFSVDDNDVDRIYSLIKERFHKNVIQEETRIKQLKETYKVSEKSVLEADNIINQIVKNMNSGTKMSKEEIDNLIKESISDSRQFSNVENLIYENPMIKDYIEGCTHRSLYTKFDKFDKKNIDEAIKSYDDIMNKINSGYKITKDDLYNYFGKLNTEGDEVLKELILKHDELAAIFKTMY